MAVDADLGAHRDRIGREAADELWRYLAKSAAVGPGARVEAAARFARLSPEAFRRLAEVHFILSDAVTGFVRNGVPSVLRRVARSTTAEVTVGPEVRGAIDWGATVAMQAASGWAMQVYAFSEASPVTDVPPNRVLKTTLEFVRSVAARVSSAVPGMVGDAESRSHAIEAKSWAARANEVGQAAGAFLRDPLLAGVTAPRHLAEHDLRAAERDRNRGYATAVRVHRLRQALLERHDPSALRDLISRRLMVPGQESRIFELWILSRVARLLEARLGPPLSLPLLSDGKSGAAYRFRTASGERLEVFFQTLPRRIRDRSVYRHLFEAYSLDVGTRLPDIAVQVGVGPGARTLLLEAKASRQRTYIADGAYKLLGYLSDFSAALRPVSPDAPLGLLVALGNVGRDASVARAGHPLWIADVESLDSELASLLAPAFNP